MVFDWLFSKEKEQDDKLNKRLSEYGIDMSYVKTSLKNIQFQIDNLDIRMLEVKKDYHKKLKQAVDAIKEEEEAEQEEEGKQEKFI
jgi:hypothetical protein